MNGETPKPDSSTTSRAAEATLAVDPRDQTERGAVSTYSVANCAFTSVGTA